MKKLLALGVLALSALASAGPLDIVWTIRNSTDSGQGIVVPVPVHPTTGVSILTYDPSTPTPGYILPGTCLTITSSVLALTSACTPVNADWNASSGLAQILNKPTIPAAQVNADWAAASGVASILNKPSSFPPSPHTHGAMDIVSGTIDAARLPIALTTTGSGAATYNAATGALNIPTPAGAVPFNYGAINPRTFAASTAYQLTDPTKAGIAKVSPSCTASLSLTAGGTCTIQARVGNSSLTCSNGTVIATWTNANTGTLTIGLGLNQLIGSPGNIELAIGEYFILCPTSGTFTIANGTDRSQG